MKKRILSTILSAPLAIALSFGILSAAVAAPPTALNCPDGQNIVVHLKRHINDLQGAQLAVRLATHMEQEVIDMPGSSPDMPVNVSLFLTLQGPRLIDPANPQNLSFGSDPMTLEQVVTGFLNSGGTIYACGICAIEIGVEPWDELLYADLFPGQVKIATEEDISRIFLCADKVVDF